MINKSSQGLRFQTSGDWDDIEKPIIVFIHGMGGSLHNFRGVYEEAAQFAAVLAVELPGHGRSCDDISEWNLETISQAINLTVREIVGDRESMLVGHSLGSFIAVQLAIFDPGRYLRIVAISGDLFHVAKLLRDPLRSIFVDPTRMIALGGALATATARPSGSFCERLNTNSIFHWLLWPFLNPLLTRKEEHVGDSFREQGGRGAFRLLKLAKHVNLDQLYSRCPVPIIFVVGDQDPLSTAGDRQHVLDSFGPDSLIPMPLAAHWPHVEVVKDVGTILRQQYLRTRPPKTPPDK